MVSRKEAAAAFTAAAKALDVRGKELGDLCFALSKLLGEELEVFPIDGDNEAIVEFMRSVKASAAGLGMGSAAGAVVLERLEKLEETLGEKIREENLQLEEKLKLELGEKIREENLQLKLKLGEELGEIQEEIRDQSQFVRVLMQGDITATSSKDSTPYRENAFRYYGYSARPETVKCMVTGKDMPAASIKAGHIFRQGWNRGYLPLLGVTSVHDPRNIILVRTEVETAFDRFEVAIIPQNEGYQVSKNAGSGAGVAAGVRGGTRTTAVSGQSADPGQEADEGLAHEYLDLGSILIHGNDPATCALSVIRRSADIFSLGCILAEVATGQPLFPGRSTKDRLHRVMRLLRPMGRRLRPGLGPDRDRERAELAADGGATGSMDWNGSPVEAGAQGDSGGAPVRLLRWWLLRQMVLGSETPGAVPRTALVKGSTAAAVAEGELFVDLVESCLQLDPMCRPTAEQLLQMPYLVSYKAAEAAAGGRNNVDPMLGGSENTAEAAAATATAVTKAKARAVACADAAAAAAAAECPSSLFMNASPPQDIASAGQESFVPCTPSDFAAAAATATAAASSWRATSEVLFVAKVHDTAPSPTGMYDSSRTRRQMSRLGSSVEQVVEPPPPSCPAAAAEGTPSGGGSSSTAAVSAHQLRPDSTNFFAAAAVDTFQLKGGTAAVPAAAAAATSSNAPWPPSSAAATGRSAPHASHLLRDVKYGRNAAAAAAAATPTEAAATGRRPAASSAVASAAIRSPAATAGGGGGGSDGCATADLRPRPPWSRTRDRGGSHRRGSESALDLSLLLLQGDANVTARYNQQQQQQQRYELQPRLSPERRSLPLVLMTQQFLNHRLQNQGNLRALQGQQLGVPGVPRHEGDVGGEEYDLVPPGECGPEREDASAAVTALTSAVALNSSGATVSGGGGGASVAVLRTFKPPPPLLINPDSWAPGGGGSGIPSGGSGAAGTSAAYSAPGHLFFRDGGLSPSSASCRTQTAVLLPSPQQQFVPALTLRDGDAERALRTAAAARAQESGDGGGGSNREGRSEPLMLLGGGGGDGDHYAVQALLSSQAYCFQRLKEQEAAASDPRVSVPLLRSSTPLTRQRHTYAQPTIPCNLNLATSLQLNRGGGGGALAAAAIQSAVLGGQADRSTRRSNSESQLAVSPGDPWVGDCGGAGGGAAVAGAITLTARYVRRRSLAMMAAQASGSVGGGGGSGGIKVGDAGAAVASDAEQEAVAGGRDMWPTLSRMQPWSGKLADSGGGGSSGSRGPLPRLLNVLQRELIAQQQHLPMYSSVGGGSGGGGSTFPRSYTLSDRELMHTLPEVAESRGCSEVLLPAIASAKHTASGGNDAAAAAIPELPPPDLQHQTASRLAVPNNTVSDCGASCTLNGGGSGGGTLTPAAAAAVKGLAQRAKERFRQYFSDDGSIASAAAAAAAAAGGLGSSGDAAARPSGGNTTGGGGGGGGGGRSARSKRPFMSTISRALKLGSSIRQRVTPERKKEAP
ncbi:hypothetical protein VOLCADRAFT_102629 [Volvox carteri f. nagariensis]|uniref:Protein kinase domain-containing protein n=1 Tax=Volvox carteri f. nagariensis TaxID=3068 RepID=D8TH52_VOLCA|nr:uncharacterized protein VOLCADRAFT_102629 [Volvox carteri f. nagariensis]EFJ53010.1 hypothetical protein VOLCADRAFT_102629 [Volvox carteri f. nagariensis]|eukprot:XP_002946015.1 hypothetical protein VOLCADRAFT_102629 [Volvox carteri f. nagariensis]